ncbi:MAG: class I SAM-dependent methyltransferase [Bacteroidetes bacterium]|nr:MAG: class I SAM-dependent methyltransferase [Bacteroidota bacterium]
MESQREKVGRYFDKLAPAYFRRFSKEKPYHADFFTERLHLATDQFDFNQKHILDVGAGTGVLYDFLKAKCAAFRYEACDISPQMMAQSAIPEANRHIGQVFECGFPPATFDFVFLLGVTSYMSESDLRKSLACVEKILAPGGVAVISFANKKSLDALVRRILRPIARRTGPKTGVLAQSFDTFYGDFDQVCRLFSDQTEVRQVKWFNHNLPVLNTMTPRLSVWLSKKIRRYVPDSALKRWLSADFLIFVARR